MLGYWVILVGIVLDVIGSVWDAIDDIVGEKALGGVAHPRITKVAGDSCGNPGPRDRI